MLHLHYHPGNASMSPHLLLRELGIDFELKLVDRSRNEQKSADYLKLNPNGLIPVLVDDAPTGGDGAALVLYESAAILLYLVDKHPEAGFAPAIGSVARAHFYKWLVWLSGSGVSMMQHYFYSDRMVAPGNAAGAGEVKARAEARLAWVFDQIDAHLASHGGPWFMGTQYSALDPYVFMLCRWSRGFGRPARSLPHIAPFLERMLARPAVQKVFEVEQLALPAV